MYVSLLDLLPVPCFITCPFSEPFQNLSNTQINKVNQSGLKVIKEIVSEGCCFRVKDKKVGGNILPGFCEDRKANVGSLRDGRPEKDKNIQNIENAHFILYVYYNF